MTCTLKDFGHLTSRSRYRLAPPLRWPSTKCTGHAANLSLSLEATKVHSSGKFITYSKNPLDLLTFDIHLKRIFKVMLI